MAQDLPISVLLDIDNPELPELLGEKIAIDKDRLLRCS